MKTLILILVTMVHMYGIWAQPSYDHAIQLGSQTVYRDIKNINLYYYQPLPYQLATDDNGKPQFSLIKNRYTGTTVSGDKDQTKFSNLLQFRIVTSKEQNEKIKELQKLLLKQTPNSRLLQMPLKKMNSYLVFAPIENTLNAFTDTLSITSNESTADNGSASNSLWTDRTIAVKLSNEDAMLIEQALRNKQSLISFAYTQFGSYVGHQPISIESQNNHHEKFGDSTILKELQKRDTLIGLINANAIYLDVDVIKWPDLIVEQDINERIPPRYPVLTVYCYDFYDAIRDDLYAKKIEIKCTSVNGSSIVYAYTFKSKDESIYNKMIRLEYAVRLDKPYEYRIIEIDKNGDIITSEWMTQNNWGSELDITSPPEKIITIKLDNP